MWLYFHIHGRTSMIYILPKINTYKITLYLLSAELLLWGNIYVSYIVTVLDT